MCHCSNKVGQKKRKSIIKPKNKQKNIMEILTAITLSKTPQITKKNRSNEIVGVNASETVLQLE